MNHLLDDIAEPQQIACPSRPSAASTECRGYSNGAIVQQSSMVLDVEVSHHGTVHKASYFVEHGVIHAKIGDGVRQFPLDDGDAGATVMSHLTGYLHQIDRKRALARIWSSVLGTPSQ
ncbi:hypothetical protein ABIB57_003700 [Devosia sp. UYZn731]|uniref:hypothetical protein n=1 Tax=Devosia sp. UYZn731 TaxID=3156345 RepID=UPI003390F80C